MVWHQSEIIWDRRSNFYSLFYITLIAPEVLKCDLVITKKHKSDNCFFYSENQEVSFVYLQDIKEGMDMHIL